MKRDAPTPATQKKKRAKWGADGADDGKSSLEIVINWLTEPGNYQRYRGGDPSCGLSKNTITGGIVGRLIDAGIMNRTAKDATTKFATI